jgi:prophage regulatory protein
MHDLPEVGFLRLTQIVGRRAITQEQADSNRAAGRRNRSARPAVPAIIPISSTAWWRGVQSGRYPKPIKHGGTTLWRVADIRSLVEQIARSFGGAK